MTEQFGAVPVRAFGDTRLSAADFRLMGAIAYFDRLGRNAMGCYVDPRKLADLAAIDYKHVARHTRRLQEFGYLEINRSATDRRKRVYSLIYNEDRGVVANSGDNLARDDASGDTVSPMDEKVTTSGDNPAEKVTNANSQVIDPIAKSPPKRLSEAYLRDPAKRGARNGENTSRHATEKPTNHARQRDRGGGNSRAQGYFMMPIRGGNHPLKKRASAPDWSGWAGWLQTDQGMTKAAAWAWLMATLKRIETERGVDSTEARAILDRELKRRRKAAA